MSNLLQRSVCRKGPLFYASERGVERRAQERIRLAQEAVDARKAAFAAAVSELEAAQIELRKILGVPEVRPPTIREIQEAVCKEFNISHDELLAFRRDTPTVRRRQIAMFLAKNLTQHSLPQIGKAFSNRDHTTVLHACRVIVDLISEKDAETLARVAAIKVALGVNGNA